MGWPTPLLERRIEEEEEEEEGVAAASIESAGSGAGW